MKPAEVSGAGPLDSERPDGTLPATLSDSGSPNQIPAWIGAVGPGWTPILVALHIDLVALDPDYQVGQLKEKFGSLRVYLDSDFTPEVEQAIEAATTLSTQTCEVCGRPGSIRHISRFWIKAVCDGCEGVEAAANQARRQELQQ